jgi:hypothetical protein
MANPNGVSALLSSADIASQIGNVRKLPTGDIRINAPPLAKEGYWNALSMSASKSR